MSATLVDRSADDAPDVATSRADYAARFRGTAGRYLLEVQWRSIERALDGLPPGSVLDVGGGHGQLAERFAARGWHVTVHGTSVECERNLRELHGVRRADFVRGPLHALPAADRSHDLVIAVRLISHVAAWEGLLAEMCRVARRAVVFDYPATTGVNALTPVLFAVKRSLEGNTRTYSSFRVRDLDEVVAGAGFQRRRLVKQLCLPMGAHRVARGALPLRLAESACRGLGLTALVGSPGIYRADRVFGGRA